VKSLFHDARDIQLGSSLYVRRRRPTFVPSDWLGGERDIEGHGEAKKELKLYSNVNYICSII
jgi:hypothetical protein